MREESSYPNITFISGDVLESPQTHGVTVIGHQCNTLGRWEAGIHKAIGRRFPEVVEAYLDKHANGGWHLGDAEIFPTRIPGLGIAYLAGQSAIGNAVNTGKRYTNYAALAAAMGLLKDKLHPDDVLAFPYLIGCRLAGGDPDVVLNMISTTFRKRSVLIFRKEA